jgi:hypothetical protein
MGGKAFDNVVDVPRHTSIRICAWVLTLFELRDQEYDPAKFEEFYLGLTQTSDRASDNGDMFYNLHELFVKNGLRTLGSTGKKDLSGDVDIAVSSSDWTYDSLVSFLMERYGSDNVKINPSINQVYTRVLVPGSGWHQVDYMLGEVELLEFTHWSPFPGTSRYSGSHRTELIKAVAKALSDWTMVLESDHEYNPGEMVGRLGYTLNHDKGLVHGGRFAPKRKDGKGYVKKMIPVTAQNVDEFVGDFFPRFFMARYPDEIDAYSEDELITKTSTDPVFIARQLFGEGICPEALETYESVRACILGNPELYEEKDLIWKLFCERLVEIGKEIPNLAL